jgi:hypothetical protein
MVHLRLPLAVLALLCAVAVWCFAGPAMSHNAQVLRMPVDGCMRRAARVLEMEGYTVNPGDDNQLWGDKGPHGACIMCNGAPGGLTQVNIVVATSDAQTAEPAQREAERLQRRMEELSRDRGFDRRR